MHLWVILIGVNYTNHLTTRYVVNYVIHGERCLFSVGFFPVAIEIVFGSRTM